jgi:hypothetical protein
MRMPSLSALPHSPRAPERRGPLEGEVVALHELRAAQQWVDPDEVRDGKRRGPRGLARC